MDLQHAPIYISSDSSSALFHADHQEHHTQSEQHHTSNSLTSEAPVRVPTSGEELQHAPSQHLPVNDLFNPQSCFQAFEEPEHLRSSPPSEAISNDSAASALSFVLPQQPNFQDAVSVLVSSLADAPMLSTHNFLPETTDGDALFREFLLGVGQEQEVGLWGEALSFDDLASLFVAQLHDGSDVFDGDHDQDSELAFSAPAEMRVDARRKIEVPLLDTDVESDVRRMLDEERWKGMRMKGRKIWKRWQDDGKGLGGFGESRKVVDEVKVAVKEIEEEAADVFDGEDDIAELIGLGDWRNISWNVDDMLTRRVRKEARLEITPPLSPVHDEGHEHDKDGGYIPALDTLVLDQYIISEGADPGEANLETIEQSIVKQDPLVSSTPLDEPEDLMRLFSPLSGMVNSPKLESQRIPVMELRVDVPLASDPLEAAVEQQEVTEPESIFRNLKKVSDMLGKHELSSENTTSDEMVNLLRPLTENLIRDIEHEPLTEADAASRVPVPVLDLVTARLPWLIPCASARRYKRDIDGTTAEENLMLDIKLSDSKSFAAWQGAAKIERLLAWSPFPSDLGKFAVQESIEDGGYAGEIQEMVSEAALVTAESLLPELDALKIDEDWYFKEEELEPGFFEIDEKDIDYLVDEKLQQMDKEATAVTKRAIANIPQPKSRPHEKTSRKRPLEEDDRGDEDISDFSSFFNADALNRFLALRNISPSKKRRTTTAGPAQEAHKEPQPVEEPAPPLVPDLGLPSPLPPRCVFVSAALFRHRMPLLRRLEQAYPAATFIERDFSMLAGPTGPRPGPAPAFDPTAEADLLLSPSTGLVLTTLQRIQQAPLPGQAAASPLRQRLLQVSARHERIVVLVSQAHEPGSTAAVATPPGHLVVPPRYAGGRGVPAPAPTPAQTRCFAALCGFASALRCDVLVHLVPGGEAQLAAWAARQLYVFGTDAAVASEEGTWEHCLRRMGLNAFAACRVMTELKEREGQEGPHGLVAFVGMSAQERGDRFARLMGGRRVLARVERCLAEGWGGKVVMEERSEFF